MRDLKYYDMVYIMIQNLNLSSPLIRVSVHPFTRGPLTRFRKDRNQLWFLKREKSEATNFGNASGVVRKFFIPQLWQLEQKILPPSTALTTRWLEFFYTHFTLRSVETYPYFWISGINLVSQSSQLYKIRVLPAKIKLLIIWARSFTPWSKWKLSSVSNKRKQLLTICFCQTFYLNF